MLEGREYPGESRQHCLPFENKFYIQLISVKTGGTAGIPTHRPKYGDPFLD